MHPAKENDIVDRGNKPYASQDLKPSWLDREGFLHFARIRENPNMMLRKLCLALKSESLPLQYECVQVLVAQSAYQVGTISSSIDDHTTIFEWKRDFEDIRKVCIAEIASVIEKYAESNLSTTHIQCLQNKLARERFPIRLTDFQNFKSEMATF